MHLRTRLARLEAIVGREEPEERWLSEEDWLKAFEQWGQEGHFDREPDFPAALALFREALAEAKGQADPPFDPPADFMPNLASLPDLRVFNWRTSHGSPQLHEAEGWLFEMAERLEKGTPPVSEAEFQELADWYRANEERLCRLFPACGWLDLGYGPKAPADFRDGLNQGPRAHFAGEVAEGVRRLRARFGEGPAVRPTSKP
jgi:hypothetical protein